MIVAILSMVMRVPKANERPRPMVLVIGLVVVLKNFKGSPTLVTAGLDLSLKLVVKPLRTLDSMFYMRGFSL